MTKPSKNGIAEFVSVQVSLFQFPFQLIAMGSSLGGVLANILMVGNKISIIPRLENKIKMRERYVNDTICFRKAGSANLILITLNSFCSNIKFTIEIEKDSVIRFLAVLFIKAPYRIHTTVYHKKVNSDLYIHWNFFPPSKQK